MYYLGLHNKDGGEVYTEDSERIFATQEEAEICLEEISNDGGYAFDHGELWIGGYVYDETGHPM